MKMRPFEHTLPTLRCRLSRFCCRLKHISSNPHISLNLRSPSGIQGKEMLLSSHKTQKPQNNYICIIQCCILVCLHLTKYRMRLNTSRGSQGLWASSLLVQTLNRLFSDHPGASLLFITVDTSVNKMESLRSLLPRLPQQM